MQSTIRTITALFAGTALAGFSSPLLAQSTEPPQSEVDEVQDDQLDAASADNAIVVTGTRIRGARIIGDTISLDRETIVEAGQIDLGEAIRSLPQNFSGGQNPGIGSGAGFANSNVNSASSANLRGLGPDATLTLLNGHRLPYDSAFAGVDISSIPLAAVDRIEVVPDGASALYGSDAVAGVVNVILRRDFEGITTSAQIGASTDGGNFRQQADIVAGTRWSGGGFFVAYDFANNSAIEAGQRSYASSLDPETTLFPSQQHHAVTLSAHHELAPGLEASIDALYSSRSSTLVAASSAFRSEADPEVESYTLAPSLKFDVAGDWQATVLGVFGRDRTHYRTAFALQDGSSSVTEGCFCNEVFSLEAGLEGPLFTLPGGEARLAVGAGLRNNLFLPVVSPRNAIDGVAELTLSAAARHEDYPGLDQQTTPRFGLSYAPVEGLTLRGSWARSFKAPTLFQRFIPYQTILLPAAVFGAGTGSDTVFFTSGGNPDVTSERARSWTAGVELQPVAIPELTISATSLLDRFSVSKTSRAPPTIPPMLPPMSTTGTETLRFGPSKAWMRGSPGTRTWATNSHFPSISRAAFSIASNRSRPICPRFSSPERFSIHHATVREVWRAISLVGSRPISPPTISARCATAASRKSAAFRPAPRSISA